jgi:hypothetical protein
LRPAGGVYLEAAYSVKEELAAGEYFALQVSPAPCGWVETSTRQIAVHRFGYVRISESDGFVQLEDCVLVPAARRPEIRRIVKDGKEFYGQGMYKTGEDIPLGSYYIEPDLFLAGNGTRKDIEWKSTNVYDWIGYRHYDKHDSQMYAAQLGLHGWKAFLRKTAAGEVLGTDTFVGAAQVELSRPGEYIELIKVKLLRVNLKRPFEEAGKGSDK